MRTFSARVATKFNTNLMMPLNLKRLIVISLLCSLLGACVYHVDVQQGNKLDINDIEQVQIGMTESQVRYLLGSPVIGDSFHKDRWDYMYYFLPGRAKQADQRWIIIRFEAGRVSEIELDVLVEQYKK
ncbi:MAG: outer membrane protein assembly factor BamE [Gammaproteobacteria bacterium]|nr:outer membrane protein assembly factor BamE [Gammaproteobacteria bacterium]